MRRTQRLRFLNTAIWIAAITVSLFIIGFVTRVGSEWSKTPIDRIGTNHFRFHIADSGRYFIYFQCQGEDITASYDVAGKNFQSFPGEVDALDEAVRWTAVYDGELFSASMAAPFVLSGKEAFKRFNDYTSRRLDNIRLFRKTSRNRWMMLAVLSLGGYWGGDYVASQLDVPCRRSNDLDWLKTVDWAALTRAIYDHRAHEVGRCANSIYLKLEQTENPELQEIKKKYFHSDDPFLKLLLITTKKSDIIRDLIDVYPSPEIGKLLPNDDFDFITDFMYEIKGEDLSGISDALGECRRISDSL